MNVPVQLEIVHLARQYCAVGVVLEEVPTKAGPTCQMPVLTKNSMPVKQTHGKKKKIHV